MQSPKRKKIQVQNLSFSKFRRTMHKRIVRTFVLYNVFGLLHRFNFEANFRRSSDIEITAREIGKLKKELYEIIASHTGQKYDKVYEDSDRDYWMKAPEAKKYGMIDEVLSKK